MAEVELLEPVLGAGIQSTHYFNGRVLTAEDLRTDQDAQRRLRAVLGQAIGEGVLSGLEVELTAGSGSPPGTHTTVRVRRGQALNRDGDVVVLGLDTDLALVKSEDEEAEQGGQFAICKPPQATLTNPGLYILSIMPASGTAGRAAMTELGGTGVASSCGARFEVEGAQFRLAALTLSPTGASSLTNDVVSAAATADTHIVQGASLSGAAATAKNREIARDISRLRNLAAYLCLGHDNMTDFATSPFPRTDGSTPGSPYGLLDTLRAAGALQSCEVPLALLYWSRRGVEYVDAWAVRRAPTSQPVSLPWAPVDHARRSAEAVARLLQFQSQLDDLRRAAATQSELAQVKAKEWFRFLPPCGFLPVAGAGATRFLDRTTFFQDLALGDPVPIDLAKVEALMAEGQLHPPVDTAVPAMVQVYRIAPTNTGTAPPYILFVTRAAQGVLEDDAVARVFQACWDAYRGLIRSRVFLPTDATSNAETARIAMIGGVQDIMDVALQKAALAAARRLAWRDALAALEALRSVQQDLATLWRNNLTGIPDLQNRIAFGNQLHGLLNTAVPGGGPSLAAAIAASNLFGAVKAQQAINAMISTGSGEGAAHGDILINYLGDSPDGVTLFRTGPTRHRFELLNRTDRMLDIQMAATVAGTGDWVGNLPNGNTFGGAVEVQQPEGTAVTSIRVPGNGQTAVGVPFTVAIKAPTNAVDGAGVATLSVQATVGPPHDKSFVLPKVFDVGTQTPPVTRGVEFQTTISDPVTGNVAYNQNGYSYTLTGAYSDAQGPTTTDFNFSIELVASDNTSGWTVTLDDYSADYTSPNATTLRAVTQTPVALPSASLSHPTFPFRLTVEVPTRVGTNATITVRVESTEANPSDRIEAHRSWVMTRA